MSEQELMPVSKTKSSTIFLFPVNFTSKFKFKDKNGGQILTNMNKNYESIYKKLQDIDNDVELTPETKITKINEQFVIATNMSPYSLSEHLLSLVTRIASYIKAKQIVLTLEEEKEIMQKLDRLKQQMGLIQQRYIELKYENLKAATSSYLTTYAQSGTREIKVKIITELDTLKSYINGSDGPLFISSEARSKIYDEIKNLKSRIENNNPPLKPDPIQLKTAEKLHDELGGGRTRRRQKKQKKQKKTQKRHKKKTRKQKRQRK